MKVNKPIFLIGAPRSGTTVLFEAFSIHKDLAWFSNYFGRFPGCPSVSILSRVSDLYFFRGAKNQNNRNNTIMHIFPYPTECYTFWEKYCGSKFLFDYLVDVNADETERKKVLSIIGKVIRYQGKKRFSGKITGPSRIHFLNSIFPDAFFIHIIRDVRAVVSSLMKVSFWPAGDGLSKPWWNNGLTDEDLNNFKKYNRSPVALAAIQWKRILKIAREESKKISDDRYLEVKYEDFVQDPHGIIDEICRFSSLDRSNKAHAYLNKKAGIKSMNYKFKDALNNEQIEIIEAIIA